jgi:hypothetical protein
MTGCGFDSLTRLAVDPQRLGELLRASRRDGGFIVSSGIQKAIRISKETLSLEDNLVTIAAGILLSYLDFLNDNRFFPGLDHRRPIRFLNKLHAMPDDYRRTPGHSAAARN